MLKTAGEIDAMAASGALLTSCHDVLQAEVTPGITTRALDEIAEQFLRDRGGVPAFKGYHGFPATITTSINHQVVHAIPGDITVEEGDILSVDAGVILDGWVSDMARTHAVGAVSDEAQRLMSSTEASLHRGIEACLSGNTVGDIGHAVQTEVEAAGFSVVRSLVGHGVGRAMHEQPQVPNFGQPGSGPPLEPGIVIAIEPMVNAGGPDVIVDKDDGWTVSSTDGSLSAHYEHTVAVTDEGPRILTIAEAAKPVG
ncbi:MAG: type I methionyl aminopeptidase [Miltoncostaeaceae bacterium]